MRHFHESNPSTLMARGSNLTICSFCGKSHAEVKKLIAGPGVYICDNCIQVCKTILDKEFPDSSLTTEANVLIMPNVDAANISYNLLRIAAGNGITVGGILLGAARPVHILTPSATVRRIVNMTALAVVDAASHRVAAHAID